MMSEPLLFGFQCLSLFSNADWSLKKINFQQAEYVIISNWSKRSTTYKYVLCA